MRGFSFFVPLYSVRELAEETADLMLFLSLIIPDIDIKEGKGKIELKNIRPILMNVRKIFSVLISYGSFELVDVKSKEADVSIKIK